MDGEPLGDPPRKRLLGLEVVGLLVCLAAAFVGAYYGALSMRLYDPRDAWARRRLFNALPPLGEGGLPRSGLYSIGGVWGGAGGLVAGLVWTCLMARRIGHGYRLTGAPPKRIALPGLGWGLVVGGGCGVFVHIPLIIAAPPRVASLIDVPEFLRVGLIYGLWIGLWTGWFFGWLARCSTRLRPAPVGTRAYLGRWWAWSSVAIMAGLTLWARLAG